MAVHGAAARMIAPAMYWSASAGSIHAANRCLKNSHASSAIENGFTSQLTNNVTRSPRGRFPTSRMAPKSTFIIIGTIISQIRTGDRDVDVAPGAELHPPQRRRDAGQALADRHPGEHGQRDPDRQ